MKINYIQALYVSVKIRKSFLLLSLFLLSAIAGAQNQKISLLAGAQTIQKVFLEIEKQTGFSVDYNQTRLNVSAQVNIQSKDKALHTLLDELLSGSGFSYKIENEHIIIIQEASKGKTRDHANGKITGIITDASGEPIIGANVMVKGTTNGTITDIDGRYMLDASPSASLQISFIGYITQDIAVSNRAKIDIRLKEDTKTLEEVIVVGYGTQIKRDVTGSVQSIKAEDMADMPVPQIAQKIQGKFAGVQINQVSGKPGQGMTMRIRGQASLSGGTTPLYVVDGMPLVGDISSLNPDEIESISILKDASASSLYGSRAANGVVLIQTKSAQSGKQFGVDIYAGIQYVPQKGRPEMMNASEFAQFRKEIAESNGLPVDPAYQHPETLGEGTNWYNILLRPAAIQNYSVNYSNGDGKFKSSSVVSYFKQDGVLLNSNYQRFSARANTEYAFSDKVRVGMNIAPSYSIDNTPQSDGNWTEDKSTIIQGALLTTPLAPYRNADGSLPLVATGPGLFDNPNWYNVVQIDKNKTQNIHLIANGFLEIQPIKDLKLKTSINADLNQQTWAYFKPSTSGEIYQTPTRIPRAKQSTNLFYTWVWENTATYSKEIAGHSFDLLVGQSVQKYRSDYNYVYGTNFPDDKIPTMNAATTITANGDINEWALLSFIGRLNYNYLGKYLLSAAIRRDGSSRFGINNRWGNFPSVSAGWIFSEESFMKPLTKVLSFGKIRASYGVVGNDQIGNYTHLATIATTNANFNNAMASGRSIAGMGNTELGWERNKQFDLGLDVGFFNNRLSFMYDYYNKITDALLFSLEVPISSGFFNIQSNAGKLKFWGHEFTVTSKNLVGAFQWTTDLNLSYNDNRCLELGVDNAPLIGNNITQVGERIGQFYGLEWQGVYKNQEEYDRYPKHAQAAVGTIRYKDVNNDGSVTQGDDRAPIGNPVPLWILGMTNSFSYKNFDLSVVMSGAFGFELANMVDQFAGNLDGVFNVYKDVQNRWKSPEDPGNGRYGTTKMGTTGPERDWFSSRYLYNGNYLTIKNITLGYKIPMKRRDIIKNMRVYMSFQNVYTFTSYVGANPEVNTSNTGTTAGSLQQGFDYTTYPVPRTVTLGLNVNF